MVFCPDCGVENKKDTKLCIHCNKDLTQILPTRRYVITGGVVLTAIGVIWLYAGLIKDSLFYFAPIVIILGILVLIIGLKGKPDLKCPKCNTPLPQNITYCVNCGALLSSASNQ